MKMNQDQNLKTNRYNNYNEEKNKTLKEIKTEGGGVNITCTQSPR